MREVVNALMYMVMAGIVVVVTAANVTEWDGAKKVFAKGSPYKK
jgi:hypothetical protein